VAVSPTKIDPIRALRNRQLFGGLREFRDLSSWAGWITWLKCVFGYRLQPDEMVLYQKCTGRSYLPEDGFKELATICGRRAGKSKVAALVGVIIGCFFDFTEYLSTGERPLVLILGKDRQQAAVVFNYVAGMIRAIPALNALVLSEKTDEIELSTGTTICVKTNDFRTVRGVTVCCFIGDEVAYWNFESDSANPDVEILRAVRPSMATIPNARLILISTGYAMQGVLYDLHRQHFGKDDSPVLVWQSDTRTMNPNISQAFIDEQIELDPEAGRSEWGGLFREDISQAFHSELIEQCVVPNRIELPPVKGVAYRSFDDPCGGRQDFWAKAIAHREKDKVILDYVRVWPPSMSVHEIAGESAEIGKLYGCLSTTGDNFAGSWPKEAFATHGVTYEKCERSKSDLYLSIVPLLSAKRVELLDNDRMRKEFRRLERKRGRGGKDMIQDNGRHDDLANSIAGVIDCCMSGGSTGELWAGGETVASQILAGTGHEDVFLNVGKTFDW
jgi:hypothetical protein